MKRDMDLVRQILLAIEGSSTGRLAKSPRFPERSGAEVAEHVRLLFDAGFVQGANFQPLSGPPQFANIALTWNGHEFLEQIRDPEIWDKTKSAAGKVGSFSLSLISELATGYVKAKAASLGLPLL